MVVTMRHPSDGVPNVNRMKSIGNQVKKRLAFAATLESAFGAFVGASAGSPDSAEDRLLRRAANDAAQR